MIRFVLILSTIGGCMLPWACEDPTLKQHVTHTPVDSLLEKLEGSMAQNQYVPQEGQALYTAITHEDHDRMRTTHYNQLAYLLTDPDADSTLFLKASKAGLALAKKQHDTLAMADAFWNYGIYYLERHAYEKSYEHYQQAYGFFTGRNRYYAGKMLYNMAYISGRIKDYTGSEVLLFKAIQHFEPLEKNKQLYYCYNHLGAIYDNLHEYTAALEAYHTAMRYLAKVEQPSIYTQDIQNNIGLVYQKTGKQAQALTYFNTALERADLLTIDPALYARLLDNRAYSTLLLHRDKGVLPALQTALRIRDSLQNPDGQVISHLHLSRYYASKKDTTTALNHAQKAYALGSDMQLQRDVLHALQLLAMLAPAKRATYLQQHIALSEALQTEERSVRNKFTRIQYETDRYRKANKQLEQNQLWTIAAGIGMTLILLLSIVIFRQRAKNKLLAFESQQRQADEQIYLLTLKQQANLERGQLQERRRIAEDLHDGILARLFGVRLHWEFLKLTGSPNTVEKHTQHLASLQKIEEDIRNLSHDLKHDLFLSDSQYIRNLEAMVQRWSESGSFTYQFDATPLVAWEALDDYIKVNLYRILKEALQNITKHAAAQEVTLTLSMELAHATVELTDDGRGFTPKYASKGIGLKNIASRTEKINGHFYIDSNPGAGTRLVITFPKPDTL